MQTYTYSIQTDFPNDAVAPDRLTNEIAASAIVTAIDHINTVGDDCNVVFKAALSGGDEALLDALVAAHSGVELPSVATPVTVFTVGAPQPVAADGKPFVLPNSFPGEVLLNFTGASDKISAPVARFGGELSGLQKVGVGEANGTIDFLDGIFLAGGTVDWDGGSFGSSIAMKLVAPASTTQAPAVANQGNCNKVATGLGFNIIVPAAGNGEFDLLAPVPVPSANNETNAQTGNWDYSEPWVGVGAMVPAVNGKYALYDAELTLASFANIHLMRDTGQIAMVAPAIKPKWILPEWKLKVVLSNADAAKTLRASWVLLLARRLAV